MNLSELKEVEYPKEVIVNQQLSEIERYVEQCAESCAKKDILMFLTILAMLEQLTVILEPEGYEIVLH